MVADGDVRPEPLGGARRFPPRQTRVAVGRLGTEWWCGVPGSGTAGQVTGTTAFLPGRPAHPGTWCWTRGRRRPLARAEAGRDRSSPGHDA